MVQGAFGSSWTHIWCIDGTLNLSAGKFLAVDYRISCVSTEYNNYRVFAYAAIVIWPLGFPLSCLAMLHYYEVPHLAAEKLRRAEERAFLDYWTSTLARLGKSLGHTDALELQDLTQVQLLLLLETVMSSSIDGHAEAGPELGIGKHEVFDVLFVADAPQTHEMTAAVEQSLPPNAQQSQASQAASAQIEEVPACVVESQALAFA